LILSVYCIDKEGGVAENPQAGSRGRPIQPERRRTMTEVLTPQKMRLLAALASDPDVQAACVAAGVSRTTAYRWQSEPAFKDELARQREAALSAALESVKTQATRAAAELAGLLNVKVNGCADWSATAFWGTP